MYTILKNTCTYVRERKGKIHPYAARPAYHYSCLTSARDGVGGQGSASTAMLPSKSPVTHYRDGWVGHRAIRKDVEKRKPLTPLPGFEPRAVQAIASRYTFYAILLPTPLS